MYKLRHLRIDGEDEGQLYILHNKIHFRIDLTKFKRIYTWSLFKETGRNIDNSSKWAIIVQDNLSAEPFAHIKQDIAYAVKSAIY